MVEARVDVLSVAVAPTHTERDALLTFTATLAHIVLVCVVGRVGKGAGAAHSHCSKIAIREGTGTSMTSINSPSSSSALGFLFRSSSPSTTCAKQALRATAGIVRPRLHAAMKARGGSYHRHDAKVGIRQAFAWCVWCVTAACLLEYPPTGGLLAPHQGRPTLAGSRA